jgi:hypothetical protein
MEPDDLRIVMYFIHLLDLDLLYLLDLLGIEPAALRFRCSRAAL